MQLRVLNLNRVMTEVELTEAFAAYGKVKSCTIIKDKASGMSKGFGFVELTSEAEGLAAIKGLNGAKLLKNKIRVKPMEDKA